MVFLSWSSVLGTSESFHAYNISAWILIGLSFAFFLSGFEEKSYDPIQQMAYESIIEKNYGKSWAEVVTDRVKGNKIINDYRKEYEKKYGKQWMVKLSEDLNKKRKK